MATEYVTLRSTRPASRTSVFMGGGASHFAPAARTTFLDVSIEKERLEEPRTFTASAGGVTVSAPVMPLALIAGTASGAAAPGAGVAWGVEAVGADVSPFRGDGIVVAVLDSGIERGHTAFDGMDIREKNFVDGEPDADEHGHGTHCAGTIFGRDVDGLRIGVAPGVKRALVGKVLGKAGSRSDRLVSAIQWAVEEGANVISMSLGLDFEGYRKVLIESEDLPEDIALSRALEAYRMNVLLFERVAALVAAKSSFNQLTLLLAAAGNGSRTAVDKRFRIAVGPPAVSEGFVSVGALERSGEELVRASFSNTGADIGGPGVDIPSAKLGGGVGLMNGTSMATPHVAGVAALWAEKLMGEGQVDQMIWRTRLLASGTDADATANLDATDVRFGLARAPRKRRAGN